MTITLSAQRTAPEDGGPGAFDPASPVFEAHLGGKLAVTSKMELYSREALSIAYTPGVAEVCTAIAERPALADKYTWRSRLVAVVSDGTAVLGLGDIGPAAALPVMEGKSALFQQFGGLSSVPIVLDTTDVDEIVETVIRIAPSFGGINLEDISAPRGFEVEDRLRAALQIPVFHDDQHGTAIVVLAALRNAAALTGRKLSDLRVVVSGAGASGIACTNILLAAGIGEIAAADSRGMVHTERGDLTPVKQTLAAATNRDGHSGTIEQALVGADVFLGLSAGAIGEEAIAAMAPNSIVFALANPTPEIHPDIARRHAAIVATGRSDYPNQINNVLAFPGVFAGAFDAGARQITEGMKLAAAQAIAEVVGDDLDTDHIVPNAFDRRVAPAVAAAVARAAEAEGLAAQSR
ncbi:MAG: NADP-dependent malic enzyme [Frankiaceae bacterium]|jgi:malate dehydrogenase (oxaloacetate-decarboxylating)|nr:NADP-dependent malic enzyme [Frankiaceae bacterium]